MAGRMNKKAPQYYSGVQDLRFERMVVAFMGLCIAALILAAMLRPVGSQAGALALTTAALPDATASVPGGEARLVKPATVVTIGSAAKLTDMFAGMGYHLDRVRRRVDPVPQVFLANLPRDLDGVASVDTRKAVFLRTMLPLVLKANESILLDRGRLLALRQRQASGRELSQGARAWLAELAKRYRLDKPDIDRLLTRVDIIPPSLALSQAAEESGWGTSRFALEGNAPFGQWTFDAAAGIVPREREDGQKHVVRSYDHLLDGVRAYSLNLNSHRAYREFREMRARMRRMGEDIDGYTLAGTLTRYSERGAAYVESIRTIMRANELSPLDHARLEGATLAWLLRPGN